MHKPIKYLEKAMSIAASGAWQMFCLSNNLFPENPSFTPRWSDKPQLKSREKSQPPLAWPRQTDSLCPRCVPEIRQQIVDGKQDYRILLNERPGEIKAQIIERDGKGALKEQPVPELVQIEVGAKCSPPRVPKKP